MDKAMNCDIVPMTIADYDEVIKLWQNVEGVGLHDYEDSREGISFYLDRNPGLSFVARQAGLLVGAVLCGHDGRRGSINHLAVALEFRMHSIGKMLVDH
jgi:N-acetylglutamate synthase